MISGDDKQKRRWKLGGSVTENPLWILMSRVGDIAILSLLWLVCSLPVLTIGVASTAAMYVAHRWMAGELPSVARDFFHAFHREFRQATLAWLPVLVGIVVAWFSRNIGANTAGAMGGVITACAFILGLLLAMVFAWSVTLLARFAYTVPRLLTDSLRMAAVAPLPTLALLLAVLWPSLLLAFWLEAALYVLPLAAFFGKGASALLSAWAVREEIRRIELDVGYDRLHEEEAE